MLCRLDPSGFMFNSTVSFLRLCRCVGLKNWQHGKTDCAAEPLRQSRKISLPNGGFAHYYGHYLCIRFLHQGEAQISAILDLMHKL